MVWNLLCREGYFDHVIMVIFERSFSNKVPRPPKSLKIFGDALGWCLSCYISIPSMLTLWRLEFVSYAFGRGNLSSAIT
jgi:hypothetical protein